MAEATSVTEKPRRFKISVVLSALACLAFVPYGLLIAWVTYLKPCEQSCPNYEGTEEVLMDALFYAQGALFVLVGIAAGVYTASPTRGHGRFALGVLALALAVWGFGETVEAPYG